MAGILPPFDGDVDLTMEVDNDEPAVMVRSSPVAWPGSGDGVVDVNVDTGNLAGIAKSSPEMVTAIGNASFGPQLRSREESQSGAQGGIETDIDPDLLRAVWSGRMLTRWRLFADSAGSAETFTLSRPVSKINIFVSHSWRTAGWLKVVGLLCHLNVLRAFLVALAAHAVVHSLEVTGVWSLPMLATAPFCLPDGSVSHCSECGVQLLVACSVFFVVLLWGQVVPLGQKTCFLDKCCIHQTDEIKKQKAVRQLSVFLARSDLFVVLWQPHYFTRLWCVYELACFLHLNDCSCQQIRLCPLMLWVFTMALCLFHMLAAIASIVVLPFTIAAEWHIDWMISALPVYVQYPYLFVVFFAGFSFMYFVPAIFFWRFCKMHMRDRRALLDQVTNFSVDTAQCHLESDRDFVEGQICEWFGDITLYEHYVHTAVARHMAGLLEKQGPIPYSMVLVGSLGHILMCISYATSFLVAEQWSSKAFWHIVMAACLLCLCADAIAVNLVLRLASTSFGEQAAGDRTWRCKSIGPLATACIFGAAKALCGGLITPSCPVWWAIPLILVTFGCTLALYRYYPQNEFGELAATWTSRWTWSSEGDSWRGVASSKSEEGVLAATAAEEVAD